MMRKEKWNAMKSLNLLMIGCQPILDSDGVCWKG